MNEQALSLIVLLAIGALVDLVECRKSLCDCADAAYKQD